MPAVSFLGVVLGEVSNAPQALLEINVLNRREPFLSFSLQNDAIFFHSDLSAAPLAAHQFTARVDLVFGRLPDLAADLDQVVNGFPEKRPLPPRPHRESA